MPMGAGEEEDAALASRVARRAPRARRVVRAAWSRAARSRPPPCGARRVGRSRKPDSATGLRLVELVHGALDRVTGRGRNWLELMLPHYAPDDGGGGPFARPACPFAARGLLAR